MTTAGSPATIAVMTGIEMKRLLFFRWRSERWQSFERRRGLAEFERRFVSFEHRVLVIGPDFSAFDARFEQTFVFVPIAWLTGPSPRRSAWSAAELAMFQRCLGRLVPGHGGPGEAADVAWIDGKLFGGDGAARWREPLAVVEHRLEILSRATAAARLMPVLSAGIGPDEGGVYAPYEGDGIFSLSSV